MKREWIARIANVAAPLIACQISGEKAVGGRGPGVAEYVEALKAWATSAAARAPWGNRTASCAVFVASDGDEAVTMCPIGAYTSRRDRLGWSGSSGPRRD
jgi:hypothetical protein